jgi:lactate dehydrogenase-like 2-hydroxyacid dehydrogenase
MMTKKILIACDIGETFKNKLEEAGFQLSFVPDKDALAESVKGVHGIFIGARFRFTPELLAQADQLEAISFCGVGVGTYVNEEAATRQGIAVMNAPGVNANTVAEFAVGFLLAFHKNIVRENNDLKAGNPFRAMTSEVRGTTAGIIGMGYIGRRISEILHHGLQTSILYYSRSRKPEVETSLGARFVDLDTVLAKSDALFLALPETAETSGIIGRDELEKMKESAILINIARPGLVDGKALYDALADDRLRAAAYDGYHLSKPYPRNPEEDPCGLFSLPDDKFLCTPHTASRSLKVWDDLFDCAADNLIEFFSTGNCRNIMNPGYVDFK